MKLLILRGWKFTVNSSKAQVKGKLGHVLQIAVCRKRDSKFLYNLLFHFIDTYLWMQLNFGGKHPQRKSVALGRQLPVVPCPMSYLSTKLLCDIIRDVSHEANLCDVVCHETWRNGTYLNIHRLKWQASTTDVRTSPSSKNCCHFDNWDFRCSALQLLLR